MNFGTNFLLLFIRSNYSYPYKGSSNQLDCHVTGGSCKNSLVFLEHNMLIIEFLKLFRYFIHLWGLLQQLLWVQGLIQTIMS